MKAVVCYQYGPPLSLQFMDMPKPEPAEDEILVRVIATTINDWDWSLVRGKPYLYRLFYGLLKPKSPVFGVELAGIVEEVGAAVTKYKIGDKVYGDISGHGWGTWAEYACVKESDIWHMPEGMNFIEAASLPHASLLAWQALVDAGQLKEGQKVLINGAGGGVGTLGLQIAKSYDAHVTGVDHADKLMLLRKLGFDEVIDYQQTDFTKNGQKYDLILDAKTMKWPLSYLKSLRPTGKYVTVGGTPGRILQLQSLKALVSFFSSKRLVLLMLRPNTGLGHIENLYRAGSIKTIIDGPYPFDHIPEQLQRFGEGRHQGKIVISI